MSAPVALPLPATSNTLHGVSSQIDPSPGAVHRLAAVCIAKMQYYKWMAWIVELLDARVRDELEALPADMRARFRRIVELIQAHGLERVREPHVKHLEGPLWEMRMKGKDGISRAIYVTARGRRVVVVRVFVKKTQKTPRHELDLALQRAKEINP
jgi:phage-related protein